MITAKNESGRTIRDSLARVIPLHELFIALTDAQSLASIGQAVRRYCRTSLGSPTGAIFMAQGNTAELLLEWRSKGIIHTQLGSEVIKSGPVARVFQTGKPIYWNPARRPQAPATRYLSRLLPEPGRGAVTFLPITSNGHAPLAVLGLVLPELERSASSVDSELQRLTDIVARCFVRMRATEEVHAACAKAEDLAKKWDEFISDLSQALRSPMTPILRSTMALSSGTLPAEKQNLALEQITHNVKALNSVVEDIFDSVRISSGKLRLQVSKTRVQELARDALSIVQPMAEDKKLKILTEISEAVPPLLADPYRLRQSFLHLLNNAVKFTPTGGTISLKVLRRGNNVECTVSDNGRGIDSKFLPFLFERFRPAERNSKHRERGLGLGLSIVRQITALHSGSITAYSRGPGKGSMFVIRLPLQRNALRPPQTVTASVTDIPQ